MMPELPAPTPPAAQFFRIKQHQTRSLRQQHTYTTHAVYSTDFQWHTAPPNNETAAFQYYGKASTT
jgi:hypothetical protein